MPENPKLSIISETRRHLGNSELGDAADVIRHEGLKKGVEAGLHLAGEHELGRTVLRRLAGKPASNPGLQTYVSNLELDGPLGLAPGWDKTGKTLLAWQTLGAHHATVGGVTYFGQSGNPMPRLRTMDQEVGDHGTHVSLNSFGFWGPHVDKVAYNISEQKETGLLTIPVIVQVTLNKEFYLPGNRHLVNDLVRMTIGKVLPIADAINLGLSSPNTPGMRDAQDADEFMTRVVAAARKSVSASGREVPIILKGDGDGGEERLEKYCKWAEFREEYFDAFELINTTALPHIKGRYGAAELPGGLAGADPEYQQLALDAVKYVYEAVGDRLDIIGTGGVDSPEQALKMVEAGASAIGVNTAVRRHGLRTMRLIEGGLAERIDQKYPGTTSLDQVIGSTTARGAKHLSREKIEDKCTNMARRLNER